MASLAMPSIDIVLEDDVYRVVLKNKVMMNSWDGKASTFQAAWRVLFTGGTITIQDNQDMSLTVLLTGTFDPTIIRLIHGDYIIPRPQGVQINYTYGEMPYFGFDREDDYIAGFDTGHWT